jgi:hypothetical protein
MDEKAIVALFTQMLRTGELAEGTVYAAAEECAAAGDRMSAHYLRCLAIQAGCSSATERAQIAKRAKFRAIDGGNQY